MKAQGHTQTGGLLQQIDDQLAAHVGPRMARPAVQDVVAAKQLPTPVY